MNATWKRTIIKLSGEVLGGSGRHGFDSRVIGEIVSEIKTIRERGVQVGLVVGGGNLFRGNMRPPQVLRPTADTMGMLATTMNGLALRDYLESEGVPVDLFSNLPIAGVADPFDPRRARSAMDQGRIVLLSGGLGRPFFTTDTTAAWAALELDCPLVVKATDVDGVYSAPPHSDPHAVLYKRLVFRQVLEKELRVMDLTAITLLKEHGVALVVLNIRKPGTLTRLFEGEDVGTLVTASPVPAPESG